MISIWGTTIPEGWLSLLHIDLYDTVETNVGMA